MSDPVTNVEIEDVLSSIRRLVSESSRAPTVQVKAVPETVATRPKPAPLPADRLVLTPSLRVAEPVEDSNEARFGDDAPEVSAEMDVADYRDDTDWEDDEISYEAEDFEVDPQQENHVSGSQPSDEEMACVDIEGIALERAQELDSRIVHWEHVSESVESPYEPDEAGDSEYAGTDVDPLTWEENETVGFEEEISIDQVSVVEGVEAEDDLGDEVEDVLALSEPEDDMLDRLADKLETDAMDFVQETVDATVVPETDFSGLDSDDTLMLDEGMLRDMVSDIVRQELQGALGERITRNVRKLVRREIHRALAAHELG